MSRGLVLADISRAGDHVMVFGVLALIAAVGGLAYGLIRLVGKRRAGRAASERAAPNDRAPGA